MERNFREMVQATIQKDMQELLNGPIKQTTDIIAKVYELGLMKGLEIQRNNLQPAQPVKWVSVEERLPDENCVVFVCLGGTEYLSAHYRVKSKRFVTVSKDKQTLVEVRKSVATYTVCGDCVKEERLYSEGQREDITSLVTHWMSIPKLMKVK